MNLVITPGDYPHREPELVQHDTTGEWTVSIYRDASGVVRAVTVYAMVDGNELRSWIGSFDATRNMDELLNAARDRDDLCDGWAFDREDGDAPMPSGVAVVDAFLEKFGF